ncbi:MAG: hypothetical protein CFE37_11195 [Alphaproteobacteria bacterium PA4]|nr:MAG: hypothetical protein CFE37_11195 [Alphaproteobacteria bacterium PA4]
MSDDADLDVPPPRRWPLVLALLASLLWLALLILLGLELLQPGTLASAGLDAARLVPALALALGGSTALAALWLIAERLRDASGARAAQAALLARQIALADQQLDRGTVALAGLESRLDTLFERITSLAAPIDAQTTAIAASGSGLAAVAQQVLSAGSRLADAVPAARAQADALAMLLTETEARLATQVADTETLLAGLWSRVADLTAATATATDMANERLAAITAAAANAQTALAAPIADIAAAADAAFARTAAAADATRDGVHTQTSALLASVEQARVTFDHIGTESARQISRRLETLLEGAAQLSEQLDSHAARYRSLFEQVERGFGVLDAKLGNSIATGNSALESVALRMTDARDAIFRLGEPIAATEAALVAVEGRVADVGSSTRTALTAIGSDLPAALPQVAALAEGLDRLHERSTALAAPIATGGETIAEAEQRLELARRSLDAAAVTLASELATARATLADIETLTGTASLAASSQLIDVFGRVRDIAGQTAGTMRDTLAGIVSEAETALEAAGSRRAETAFATPIRARLAEIETAHDRAAAAAQAATERVTNRLLALTRTIAEVEARIDEADAHYDMRLRDDIAKRSQTLLASLQDGAIDIAKLLSSDVSDEGWARYLRGDKGLFARRAARLIDANTERAIARHFKHDPAFAEQASRYITEFEALIARVLPDREGKGLAVTLLSSDVGKLYVALAQATERLR